MRALALWVTSAVTLTVASASSCVLELEPVVVCGDGYVDEDVGEQCDPNAPSSFAGACDATGVEGVAGCDPDDCTLRCVGCGDGIVQHESIGGRPPEECDEGPDVTRATEPRACVGLQPWNPGLPYASGTSARCTAECFYDRSACSYCGNDSADEKQWPLAPSEANQPLTYYPETCDGEDLSSETIADAGCPAGSEPNVVCAPDCLSTIPRDGPRCCVSTGSPCEDPALCCHAYAHPGDSFHCENPLTGEPMGEGPPVGGGWSCR